MIPNFKFPVIAHTQLPQSTTNNGAAAQGNNASFAALLNKLATSGNKTQNTTANAAVQLLNNN